MGSKTLRQAFGLRTRWTKTVILNVCLFVPDNILLCLPMQLQGRQQLPLPRLQLQSRQQLPLPPLQLQSRQQLPWLPRNCKGSNRNCLFILAN